MNIQQIRAQIAALQDATMDENKNFRTAYDEGKFDALSAVDALLDSLQEEPVSKDLEEAAVFYANTHTEWFDHEGNPHVAPAFKAGAKWQKENLWKDAQGDDLPEIDREVIILYRRYLKENNVYNTVGFAHRPKEYWCGKNIATGEITRYYPKRYDKGDWNIPDVQFWLDLELPTQKGE